MNKSSVFFNVREVKSTLEGRKTQFRFVLRPQPAHLQVYEWKGKVLHDSEYRMWCWNGHVGEDNWSDITFQLAQYLPIQAGTYRWVREPFASSTNEFLVDGHTLTVYKADLEEPNKVDVKWRSPVRMKREQSRLTLKIHKIKVEPLWDILTRPDDVVAEGFHIPLQEGGELHDKARWVHDHFRPEWDERHSRSNEKWMANPWVIRAEFFAINRNIDNVRED